MVIDGPKSCGKTWTGLRHSRSSVMFDRDPDARLSAAVNWPDPLELLRLVGGGRAAKEG